MSRDFFEHVADAVVGLVPPELGPCTASLTSGNVKVWFGGDPREHYEAQFLRDGSFEIGFHAEHRSADRNEAVIRKLVACRRTWEKRLGTAPDAGPFADSTGRPWRRLSEIVPVPDTDEVEAALEVADRLAAYIEALEPIRRSR